MTFEIRTKFEQLPAETLEFLLGGMRYEVTIESAFQLKTLAAYFAAVVALLGVHVRTVILEGRKRMETGAALVTNELAIIGVQVDMTTQAGAQRRLEIAKRAFQLSIFVGVRSEIMSRQCVHADEYFITTFALEQRMIIQSIFTLM